MKITTSILFEKSGVFSVGDVDCPSKDFPYNGAYLILTSKKRNTSIHIPVGDIEDEEIFSFIDRLKGSLKEMYEEEING